jgi:hypothetical protein
MIKFYATNRQIFFIRAGGKCKKSVCNALNPASIYLFYEILSHFAVIIRCQNNTVFAFGVKGRIINYFLKTSHFTFSHLTL